MPAPPRPSPVLGLLLLLGVAAASGCAQEAGDDSVPEDVIRHNILGTAHLGQTKWAEAEAEFRRALEQRPDDPLLLTNAAIALNQEERPDEALALLARAVTADPDYAAAHFNMGLIESRRGEFAKAATHFERTAALEPDDLFTRYYLGTSLARIGREAEGIEALRRALELDAAHVSALYALGRLLLQQGDQEEGMQKIMRSQEVRARSGLDEAVGNDYGEQGRLSHASDYPGGALPAPAAIPVRFEVASSAAVATGRPGRAWTIVPAGRGAAVLVASGATVLEVGASQPRARLLGEETTIVALAAGDADNDGTVDLAALVVQAAAGTAGTLRPVWMRGVEAGWQPVEGGFSGASDTALDEALAGGDLALVDRDHDGDLDLFWCWAGARGTGGCLLGTNDGAGRFEARPSAEHGFTFAPGSGGPIAVSFSDVDNDRDVDLLVADPAGVRLYSNQRDGSFEDLSETAGLAGALAGASALAIADLNKDGWMDLLVATPDGSPRLASNHRGRFAAPQSLGDVAGGATTDLAVFDFDNDGFLDVSASSPEGLLAYHNRGAGRWETRSDLLRVAGLGTAAAPLGALDVDADGDLDLAVADGNGSASILTNQGGNANRWIDLAARGVGDNKFGIGAKIEILAGALRQKFEVARPLPLHAGLGSRERVQAARFLWPSGVLQDEIELPAGAATEVAQLDRKGTSCPLLYAWQDGAWRFVTDFLGGAAIGYQHSPGVYGVPDTTEYVRLEGGLDADGEGRLQLRLNNQLEEVIWFDQVELVVVDHPAGTEVYPDERLMPAPPFPEFRLFGSADVRPVVAARMAGGGADVTELLRERDRRYVEGFALLRPKGYAELHAIELDLGPLPAGERVVLLLDGWIDYADSSANVAARQAGLLLVPPRLHVADGRGGWTEVGQGRMGFPAGLPKTMAVELTGLFPASRDHRLRIETSMRIYWDRARVMVGGADTPLEVTRLRTDRATLGFGGFPRPISPDGRPPFEYDPADVAVEHGWKAHVGEYTGYGDVAPLLADIDDRFVTTRSGDEIELTFVAPPPPRAGFARTFLLFADGFGKDMDPNSAAGDEVGLVPFHAMRSYPYAADVVPPTVQHAGGPPPRSVAAVPEGWPGALPLGRHADR